MKMKIRKSIVLKRNMKNLMTSLLPMAKTIVNKKINKIKSRIMQKIRSTKKRQNTLKKVSNNRRISLQKITLVLKLLKT